MNSKGSLPKHKVGDTIGRLTITKRAGSSTNKQALWECLCSCGNTAIVKGSLLGKVTTSCGCYRKETTRSQRWKGVGDLSMSYWAGVVRNALARGIPMLMTIDEAWLVFTAQDGKCALSGLPIALNSGRRRYYHGTASLDRINNDGGYTIDNVQWLHKDVNIMKKDHSTDYFVELCRAVTQTVGR